MGLEPQYKVGLRELPPEDTPSEPEKKESTGEVDLSKVISENPGTSLQADNYYQVIYTGLKNEEEKEADFEEEKVLE